MQECPFSIVALRVLNGCDKSYSKILKYNEFYFFNSWYEPKDDKLVRREDYDYERTFFGDNISVQAVVGKNGSGKSSLFELIYRIANNVGYITTAGKYRATAQELYYIKNIRAELYYEINNELCLIRVDNDKITFQFGKEKEQVLSFQECSRDETNTKETKTIRREKIRKEVLNKFFYNLVVNYSLQSLNPCDYSIEDVEDNAFDVNQSWLTSLYNKNDGYMVPIGFEPYRGNNIIDLLDQRELNEERVTALLIDADNHRSNFLPEYSLSGIDYTLEKDYSDSHYYEDDDPQESLVTIIKDLKCKRCEIFIYEYDIKLEKINCNGKPFLAGFSYLMNKTLLISNNAPGYEEYSTLSDVFFNTKLDLDATTITKIANLIHKILKDSSHVSLKIRQVLNYLSSLDHIKDNYLNAGGYINYSSYIKDFFNVKNFNSLDEIIDHLPPSFFKPLINLHRDKTPDEESELLSELSSGERQFIYNMSSIFYHLRNIASVRDDNNNLIKYHNVNIFLDEIEFSAHPEYQRVFLNTFLNYIKENRLNEVLNINIMLSTHSPFILSDIPESNILLMKKDTTSNRLKSNPFGANVNDILAQGFFLSENGFMGEFAQSKIIEAVGSITKKEFNVDNLIKLIEIIGEPMIRFNLQSLLDKYLKENPQKETLKARLNENCVLMSWRQN